MKSTLVYNNLHKIVINYPAVDKAMNLAAVVSSLGGHGATQTVGSLEVSVADSRP